MDGLALQFTPFLMPIIGAAVVLSLLAVYAARREQPAPGSDVFFVLLLLSAWWCYTYALELITTDPAIMLFWVKLEWISIALLPVAWLLFALTYAGYSHRITLSAVTLLSVVPAIMIVLAWTTPAHSLLYANPGVRDVGNFVVFETERGPAFYVHVIYSYLLVTIATLLIIRVWLRSAGPQRKLALVVAAGAILPILSNLIYQVGLAADLPIYIDLTVPTFAVSAVLFAWGWFRLHLFDLVPELGEPMTETTRIDPAQVAQATQERSLNLISLSLSVLFFLALVPILTLLLRGHPSTRPLAVAYILLYLFLLGITIWREGDYIVRAVGLTAVYLGLTLLDLRVSGLSPVVGFYLVALAAFAAVLLPLRLTILVIVVGVVGLVLVSPAQSPPFQRDIYSLVYLLLSVAMTAGMLMMALVATRRDIRTLLRYSRNLSRVLEVERKQLEMHVTERTRALEISATISRQLSTILDQSRLVNEVVRQLRDALAYYHVHVYLWDETVNALRMVGGTGEAGQAMLVMGHMLLPDQGLVGRAYSTNQPVIVPDVNADSNWLPNRLLPDTRSELAVPITYGEQVLGVLDAQDNEVGGLGAEDSQLLQTIAGQLAVALRNARLVTQIQQEADQAALINAINRKIAQTTDIDGAMRTAVTELSRALEARDTGIRLEIDGSNGYDH
ncbi:MAG: GAF domain-containing protein [Candidatus Promineofilum sp.]|nr:GAF domain-containing protein [Promineifilum sp.]